MSNPKIIAWSTKGKINYRIVGKNGENLISTNQGFSRIAGLHKNLKALAQLFDEGKAFGYTLTIYWVKNSRSKTIIRTTNLAV